MFQHCSPSVHYLCLQTSSPHGLNMATNTPGVTHPHNPSKRGRGRLFLGVSCSQRETFFQNLRPQLIYLHILLARTEPHTSTPITDKEHGMPVFGLE